MDEDFPPPPFTGFPAEGFEFLRALAGFSEGAAMRPYVAANKPVYERALRLPLAALVASLSDRLAGTTAPLRGGPSRSLFRLNRDVRFSRDKRPYKTHAGAMLTRGGNKGDPGLLYIHVDPAGSFAAAGFYRPEPDVLHRLRLGLAGHEAGWEGTLAALSDSGLHLGGEEALTRLPKGFAPASPVTEAGLKLKSWHVRRDLPAELMAGPGLVDDLAGFAVAAAPLLRFGWSALDRHPAARR